MKVTPLDACRACGNRSLEPLLDLGTQALTGVFPRSRGEAIAEGPLQLVRCAGEGTRCGLVQLAHTFELEVLYGDRYGYRSGLNASMVRHLGEKAAWLQSRRPLAQGDAVLDIGCNDGTLLGFYPAGVDRFGIDPTVDTFRRFHPPGVTAVPDFFTAEAWRRVAGSRQARIITSISMFYDLPEPMRFVEDVASVLADDGVWHLEQSYLPTMLATNGYDTVCHEHLEFYGLRQLAWMTSRAGLRITDVAFNDVNGGSFAVTVEKGRGDTPRVQALVAAEQPLEDRETWARFARFTADHREALPAQLAQLQREGRRVYGLGASTKGNVVLQHCGIDERLLPAIAEVNPDKFGHFTPGSLIPIIPEAELRALRPDVLLVLPWHFRQGFLSRERPFLEGGGRLLFPLPRVEFVT